MTSNILFLITKSDLGGAQTIVQELATGLQNSSEFSATLVAGEEGPLTENLRKAGVAVYIEPNLQRNISLFSDLSGLFRLRNWFKRLKPDVVHIHSSKAGVLGRLAAVGLDCKVVFTVHGWVFKRDSGSIGMKSMIFMERLLGKLTDYLVVVSRDDAQLGEEHNIRPRVSTKIILNGATDVALPPNRPDSDSTTLKVIMVARFTEQKDQLLLAQAVAGLDRQIELTLVGNGPALETCRSKINDLNSRNPIRFTGATESVGDLLHKVDVGVLISNWEGLPVSIIEYMRAGIPVVATDVGGVKELVLNGVTGYLVPRGDIDSIRTALIELDNDRKKLQDFGQNGRNRYLEEFPLEKMMGKYFDLYSEAACSDT